MINNGGVGLKKICVCGKKICFAERFCVECAEKYTAMKKQRERQYDLRREKRYVKFYHSVEWIKLREFIINKYGGIDIYAMVRYGQLKPATTVHHIVEVKDDWNMRLDVSNLIPLSAESHQEIHGLYARDKASTQSMLKECVNQLFG